MTSSDLDLSFKSLEQFQIIALEEVEIIAALKT